MSELGYHQKGFSDVAAALYIVQKRINTIEGRPIKYVSVGCGVFEDEFDRAISDLKDIKTEHFYTMSNQKVHEYLMRADVALIPSRCEGQSMFALEAISEGCPLIFTGDNGLKEIAIDGYNGIQISAYDSIALADAIIRFYEDASLVNKYKSNSLKLYETKFMPEKIAGYFSSALKVIEKTYKVGDNKKNYPVSNAQIFLLKQKNIFKHIIRSLDKRKYTFKDIKSYKNKLVVIYGAGDVGRALYKQFLKYKIIPVLWVDKNYYILNKSINGISSPLKIKEVKFDYILVGVLDYALFDQIKDFLISIGVQEKQIKHLKPE